MSSHIIGPFLKNKVAPSEKVIPSEEFDQVTKTLDDIKYPVVTIRRKNFDNFQGHSIGSTGWFNIDHGVYLNWTFIKLLK